MTHSFDVEIATEFGVNCAILLNHIYFWVEKNRANERHFHEGKYWTYNSINAYTELFPYMSDKQIRTSLKKLEDSGLISVGNFNQSAYDRTKWYALTEKGMSILQNCNIDLPKRANGLSENGEPIPDINITDINITDNKKININNVTEDSIKDIKKSFGDSAKIKQSDADLMFEKLWKEYPRKLGKGKVSQATKRKLFSIGYDEMSRCLKRFKEDVDGRDEQYIMHGSTFFNSGYVDYLDANYGDGEEDEQKPSNLDRPEQFRTCPNGTWTKLKQFINSDGSFDWSRFDPSILDGADRKWMYDNNM